MNAIKDDNEPDWINFGIGGDRVEHVAWRALHGSCPEEPANILLWMGSNNINAAATFSRMRSTANTITNTVRSLQLLYPSTNISVIAIMPQQCAAKTKAGMQINNIVKFQLPACVAPPDGPTYAVSLGQSHHKGTTQPFEDIGVRFAFDQ